MVWTVLGVVAFFILDEIAYNRWKDANPGHLYSHLRVKTPLVIHQQPKDFSVKYGNAYRRYDAAG